MYKVAVLIWRLLITVTNFRIIWHLTNCHNYPLEYLSLNRHNYPSYYFQFFFLNLVSLFRNPNVVFENLVCDFSPSLPFSLRRTLMKSWSKTPHVKPSWKPPLGNPHPLHSLAHLIVKPSPTSLTRVFSLLLFSLPHPPSSRYDATSSLRHSPFSLCQIHHRLRLR